MPEGLSISPDEKDNITLTENNLFEIDGANTKIDGNIVKVKMVLKKKYSKFNDLYDDVKSVPDKLDMKIPNVIVKEDVSDGSKLTVEGAVTGTFYGRAKNKDNKVKAFNFVWTAKQSDEGRDSTQPTDAANKDKIRFTVQLPKTVKIEGELKGALLVLKSDNTEDSEDKAVYQTKRGKSETFTGRLYVDPIVAQIKMMKEAYGGDYNQIKTERIESEFVATITVPAEMEITDDLKAELTGTKAFKVKSTEVAGNKIIIKLDLVKKYEFFGELYKDISAINKPLDIKLTGLKVRKNAPINKNFTLNRTVSGTFNGKAITAGGQSQIYDMKWNAIQHEKGKDFIQDEMDNSINFTLHIKNSPKPDPNPNPGSKPDSKKNNGVSTGDNTKELIWLCVSLAALLVVVEIIARKKRK